MKKLHAAYWKHKYVIPGASILLFAVIGVIVILSTRAATPFANIEAENGNLVGVSTTADSKASQGSYIQFGASSSTISHGPPAAAGYFQLADVPPTGGGPVSTCMLSQLPSDAQAAAMVHRTTWEPHAANYNANHTTPPSTFITAGWNEFNYADSCHPKGIQAALFGRVDGNYQGTTDEIMQWAAAKWGLDDNIMRAEAVWESSWYQNNKSASGQPISGQGYGDFGKCGGATGYPAGTVAGSPIPSGYGTNGPSSFGIMQSKWCDHTDLRCTSACGNNISTPTGNYDGWPWTEKSTAYELDEYGATIRGCYEGWNVWLKADKSGDIWGCLGLWNQGAWYTTNTLAQNYINTVKGFLNTKPWLTWPDQSSSTPGGG